ncbi:MAG: hypothetical protein LBL24_03880 [Bacteroidales bacterium]|jgi:hypothetical protein|nr:hypothetical protein [Bacteroidales bacterium]
MTNKILVTAILSIFCVGLGFSQMEVKSERTFTGTALYGFMNGGSDLYCEYGFKELISREIVYKGEDFTVDVYTMDTPLDAFGIYSIHADKCMRADSLGKFDCLSKYQLQAVDGNAYVSIVFQSGSNAARKAADELYRIYVTDGRTGISIPKQLSYTVKACSGTVKYMKGKLGVNSVQSSLIELLDDIAGYEVWYVENPDKKNNIVLFLLQDSKDCSRLQKKIPRENIIRKGEKFVMMKEYRIDGDLNTYAIIKKLHRK